MQSKLESRWSCSSVTSHAATLDPTVEWHTVLERLVEGSESFFQGHEGMRRFWHSYRTEFEDFEFAAQELRDAGEDRVVLLGRFRWRGLASGVPTESPAGLVMTVRDGKIIRSMDYFSHEEALEAVGLEK